MAARDASSRITGSALQCWLLLAFTVVWRGLFAREPPGSDQGLFMAEGELLSRGARLYSEVWEHKPFGVPALYGLTLQLLGARYTSIHVLNALLAFTSALLLARLCARAGLSRAAGSFGGLIYLVFHSGPAFGGFWSVAQAEVFIDPLVCCALWLLGPTWSVRRSFVAGLAIGVAVFTIKMSALPLLALVVLCARAPRCAAAFLLGAAVPGVVLVTYFAATQRLDAWFDAQVIFNVAHRDVAAQAFWTAPWSRLWPAPWSFLLLYVFSGGAMLDRLWRLRTRTPHAADAWLGRMSLLWLLALLEVASQRKFWGYHYHVSLLPLAGLAAVGFERSVELLQKRMRGSSALVLTCLAALLLGTWYALRCANYIAAHQLFSGSDQLARERTYQWGQNEFGYATDRMVSAHIASLTQPTDRIVLWSFEPLIYFLAQRAPASRFLYDYPLGIQNAALQDRYRTQLLQDLNAHPPAQFVVRRDDANSLEPQDSLTQLAAFPELTAYVQTNYVPAWTLGDFVGYARVTARRTSD